MKFPVNSLEESHLVDIQIPGAESRYLTPATCREIPVLEVLPCQYESGDEHTTSALQGE